MDLSKKTLIGTLSALFLAVLTYIISGAMLINSDKVDWKVASIFVLIFSLAALLGVAANLFTAHRDMALELNFILINAAIAIIGILFLAGSSLIIDIANGHSQTPWTKGLTIELVAVLFSVPTAGAAGYLLAH